MKKLLRVRSYFALKNFYKGIFTLKDYAKGFFGMFPGKRQDFPLTVDILITKACNLKCRICWASCRPGDEEQQGDASLSLYELEALFYDLARFHPVVHFGGGEPFLRKDMALIIEKVKAAGIKCLVTTNGTLLDGDIAGRVLKSGIDGIIVSIYGDRQRHDSVTRCKGSFDKTMNAVRIIKEKKTPGQKLFLSTVVFPENPGTLEASARVARDAGVDRLKIEHLNFITRKEKEAMVEKTGPGVATSYVVEDLYSRSVSDKINEILETLSKRYRGFIMIKPALSSRQVIDWYSFSGKRLGPCYFRNHSAVINYNGDVIPCQFFPGIVYGNIKKESIADIWKKAGTLKMGTDAGEYAVCQRCCKR